MAAKSSSPRPGDVTYLLIPGSALRVTKTLAIVVNPPERKLAKRTSVLYTVLVVLPKLFIKQLKPAQQSRNRGKRATVLM